MTEIREENSFPSDEKSKWLQDIKFGLTPFILGTENYSLYGDVYAMSKNSPLIRDHYKMEKSVTGLHLLQDESVSDMSNELWIIWKYLNDCYVSKSGNGCLEKFLDDPNQVKVFENFYNLANYFHISIESSFYREILEMSTLSELKTIDKSQYVKLKDKLKLSNECDYKIIYNLVFGQIDFKYVFSSMDKALYYKRMFVLCENHSRGDNSIKEDNIEIKIKTVNSEDIMLQELDPIPPSLFEKTPEGNALRVIISSDDSLLKKLEYIRHDKDIVYEISETHSVNFKKIQLNEDVFIVVGNTFPTNKLAVNKLYQGEKFYIEAALKELVLHDEEILESINKLDNKGIKFKIVGPEI